MKSSAITAESETVLQARLVAIARQSDWCMQALLAVRSLRLASWCIGASAVRNLVWDALHGEYATSVGLRLGDDDSLRVIAPHGLGDLFAMVVRRNPRRVSVETYRQRVAQKRYQERWPKCTVVPC